MMTSFETTIFHLLAHLIVAAWNLSENGYKDLTKWRAEQND